jgi:hypothetical protein
MNFKKKKEKKEMYKTGQTLSYIEMISIRPNLAVICHFCHESSSFPPQRFLYMMKKGPFP